MELVKRAAAQEQQQEQAQQAAAVDMQVPQWRRDAEVHAKVRSCGSCCCIQSLFFETHALEA